MVADLGVHFVEGVVLSAGHTVQEFIRDYGYDLLLSTYDEQGYPETGFVLIQVKAREALLGIGNDFVFDLDVRDYNRWKNEEMPVILILYDASRNRAYWLSVQRYFRDDEGRAPGGGEEDDLRSDSQGPRIERTSDRGDS